MRQHLRLSEGLLHVGSRQCPSWVESIRSLAGNIGQLLTFRSRPDKQGRPVQNQPHDLLTRMYLRHYAFLRLRYREQPTRVIYHFATLGLSGLISVALLALLAASSLVISLICARPVVPWTLPDWALIVGAATIVFVPGWVIDQRFEKLTDVSPEIVKLYGSGEQRRHWRLMVLSVLPLCAIAAACFGILRSWQGT